MAQGAVKSKKTSAPSAGRKAKPQPPKKGARVTKAKKGSAADKMQKKFAAGMVAKTEKLLGERAGHLELIGKGRLKGADKEEEGGKKKGGSRKGSDLDVEDRQHEATSFMLWFHSLRVNRQNGSLIRLAMLSCAKH
ncbi:hypothetical protein F4805DRAFT_473502 [Annulohypoxylon moriforme]|nr:hypothetical protein F4805DRAFT_473502 [Annulohypoxylon moriforme]